MAPRWHLMDTSWAALRGAVLISAAITDRPRKGSTPERCNGGGLLGVSACVCGLP